MWMVRTTAIAGVLLLAASATSRAQDADVVLNVPVTLADVHDSVDGFSVACDVFADGNGKLGSGQEEESVDAEGNFRGAVEVSVSLEDGSLSDARRYACELLLKYAGTNAKPGQGTNVPLPARAKAGTNFVGKVEGTIQQQ